jgi:hypothetical protein
MNPSLRNLFMNVLMRSENGGVLTQQKAERARAVRAEIGRRLREQYGAPPMPARLAELVSQIESPPAVRKKVPAA